MSNCLLIFGSVYIKAQVATIKELFVVIQPVCFTTTYPGLKHKAVLIRLTAQRISYTEHCIISPAIIM